MSVVSEDTKKPMKRKKERTPPPENTSECDSDMSCNRIKAKLRNKRRLNEINSQEDKRDVPVKEESDTDDRTIPPSATEVEMKRKKIGRPRKKTKATDPDIAKRKIMQKASRVLNI